MGWQRYDLVIPLTGKKGSARGDAKTEFVSGVLRAVHVEYIEQPKKIIVLIETGTQPYLTMLIVTGNDDDLYPTQYRVNNEIRVMVRHGNVHAAGVTVTLFVKVEDEQK